MAVMTGCKERPDSKFEEEDLENPENTELSSDEQKQKLMDVATEFIGVFNTADQKEAVEAFDWIVDHYMDYYWDPVGEHYEGVLDDIMAAAARSARLLSEGNFTANAAMEIYSFPKFTGIFEANDDTYSWEYVGESDNITLRCTDKNGKPVEAVLTASGEEMNFEYEYWEYNYDLDRDEVHPFTAVVPANVALSVKVDGTEYIAFNFKFDAEKSSHVRINTEVKITNITYNLAVSVEKEGISTECTLRYGDRDLLAVTAGAPSCVLLGKGDNMDWEDWWYEHVDAFEYGDAVIKFGNLVATANILNQVQVVADSEDPSVIYQKMMDLDEKYDNDPQYDEYDSYWWDTREYNLEQSDLINDNINISLFYSSDVEQAKFITDVFESGDSYYSYYYVAPVVYFPDGTKYAFEEYFTERAFGSVIDLTEDLVNKYISLFRYNEIEPITL